MLRRLALFFHTGFSTDGKSNQTPAANSNSNYESKYIWKHVGYAYCHTAFFLLLCCFFFMGLPYLVLALDFSLRILVRAILFTSDALARSLSPLFHNRHHYNHCQQPNHYYHLAQTFAHNSPHVLNLLKLFNIRNRFLSPSLSLFICMYISLGLSIALCSGSGVLTVHCLLWYNVPLSTFMMPRFCWLPFFLFVFWHFFST